MVLQYPAAYPAAAHKPLNRLVRSYSFAEIAPGRHLETYGTVATRLRDAVQGSNAGTPNGPKVGPVDTDFRHQRKSLFKYLEPGGKILSGSGCFSISATAF